MKRKLFTLIGVLVILAGAINASAETPIKLNNFNIYTKDGEAIHTRATIRTYFSGDDKIQLDTEPQLKAPSENLFGICKDYDYMLTYDFKTTDAKNPYPAIDKMQVEITMPKSDGGRSQTLGRNFRLYYIAADAEPTEVNSNAITDGVSFEADKLGRYALYFDEAVYDVIFYSDVPTYDDDGIPIEQEPYAVLKDLKATDTVEFPEILQKDGYVFTGWKEQRGSGLSFSDPQPNYVLNPGVYYASWCLESEYQPIILTLSSESTIAKGKEDGQKITLKTNYGMFADGDEFPSEWRAQYDAESDEDAKKEILSNWKAHWNIVGSDDVMIESAERIDDATVEFVLSGNSSNVYGNANLYVEFDSSLLRPVPYEEDGAIIENDTKIKMDKDGVREKMYRSDNAITISGQSRPSSGGGHSSSSFIVRFNTNGGSDIAQKSVKRNTKVGEIQEPTKDGFIFDGWYTDKALSNKFDPDTKVTSSMTLYAKWAAEPVDDSKSKIILTIGKKEATVFGETQVNDVAPLIRNNRTMLPSRFVAESLGAVVSWNEEKELVTIKGKDKDGADVTILITIGAEYATVNGKAVKLDSPAFLENDRTYTPIRFISERLGASVEWNEDDNNVIITKNN